MNTTLKIKQHTTILVLLLISMGLLMPFNTFAKSAKSANSTNSAGGLPAEINARIAADTLLQRNIDAEAAARKAADTILGNEDKALQNQINKILPPTYVIGETLPDNSIVYYVDGSLEHGLAAWPRDEAPLLSWYDAKVAAEAHGLGWHLPTKHELNLLYGKQGVVGGFISTALYWSSSESDSDKAWSQNFSTGAQIYNLKYSTYQVRAVRVF